MMMKARFRMPEEQVDWRETIDCLLDRAKRPFVPIDKTFVQMPRGERETRGAIGDFREKRGPSGVEGLFADRRVRQQRGRER